MHPLSAPNMPSYTPAPTSEEGEDQVSQKNARFAGMVLLLIVGTIACGGIDVITNEQRYDDGANLHYLTSEGLGYCAWLVWTLVFLVPVHVSIVAGTVIPIKRLSSKGLTDSRLQMVFGNMSFGDMSLRAAKFTFKTARALFNPAMIVCRFIGLPPRDPDQPLNQAKHIVAWWELGGLIGLVSIAAGIMNQTLPRGYGMIWLLSLGAWFGSLVYFLVSRTSGHFLVVIVAYAFFLVNIKMPSHWAGVASKIDNTARYSILNSLQLLSISGFQSKLNSLRVLGPMKFLVMAGLVPLLCAFAGMSLLVKITQLDFVFDELYWDWSATEWLNLLAITNNIVGIMDLEKIARIGIFEQLRQDAGLTEHTAEAICMNWMKHFGHKLAEMWGGPMAVFICATVTPADIAAVLKD